MFGKLTTWIYRNAKHILISSRGFEGSICEKGDFVNKVIYFPNWADISLGEQSFDNNLPKMPEGFKVMFAGNIGEAQDMDSLMETALVLKDETDIHFCIVGDGRKRPWVEDFVREHDLTSTVHLLGRFPIEMMPAFFAMADVLLVTLKDSKVFNRTAPAKIQAYMNAGKPIAAMLNGEGSVVISNAECGFCVAAGDAGAFAHLLKHMKAMEHDKLVEMGIRGKQFCKEYFDFSKALITIEKLMSNINK